MKFPRLWFSLSTDLGHTIRSLRGNPEHARMVRSIAVVKRLMDCMEVSIPNESSDFDAEKFKDLWIFLGLVLDSTIHNKKEKFIRSPFLFPIALVRLFMKQMEEAEDNGIFVDFD
jgi:hypothetical protein